MSYRDDLEAAQMRAEAAERRAAQLEAQLQRPDVEETALALVVPDRFQVTSSVKELTVRWPWRDAMAVPFLGFALFWVGITLFGTANGATFMLVPFAIGLGFIYRAVASLVNWTTLSVVGEELRIDHGPLPWRGKQTLRIADLQQLYAEEHTHKDEDGRVTGCTYTLSAVAAGRQVKLPLGSLTFPQARYLERAFEGRLRIKDQPVLGEALK